MSDLDIFTLNLSRQDIEMLLSSMKFTLVNATMELNKLEKQKIVFDKLSTALLGDNQ